MIWFLGRGALAIFAAISISVWMAPSVQAQNYAEVRALTAKANALARKIHDYHDREYPPTDYCETMREARRILDALDAASGIIGSLPVPERVRIGLRGVLGLVGYRLADEVAEEDAINYESYYDPCWEPVSPLISLLQGTLSTTTATTGSPYTLVKWFVTIDGGVATSKYEFGDGFSLDHSTGIVGLRAGVDWGLGNGSTWGLMGGFYKPFEGARDGSFTSELRWFGTAELKLATPIAPNVRLWGSGGFAWGDINVRTDVVTDTAHATGWTVGAGLNYEFQPTWNVGITYRHVDVGPKDVHKFGTDVKAESDQFFLSFQKNFIP